MEVIINVIDNSLPLNCTIKKSYVIIRTAHYFAREKSAVSLL